MGFKSGKDRDIKEPKAPLDEGPLCIKYMLIVFNIIFFMMGASILGVAVWITIDRNFFSIISGNMLFSVAAYMLVAGGVIMVIVSVLGCLGAMMENKCLLLTFGVCLLVIFLTLAIGGILAGIYRTQITDHVKTHMEDTLKYYYGVDTNIQYNQAITQAWDRAQENMQCCAVQEKGWFLYRDTLWFKRTPGAIGATKPFVPKSCCVKDRHGKYLHELFCQTASDRPPGKFDGPPNDSLFYRGCYNAGVEFVYNHSNIIIGLGISFALAMITGIIFSFCLYSYLERQDA